MKEIKSFVRRNSRLTDSHKKHLSQSDGMLYTQIPFTLLQQQRFVGLEIGFGMGDSLLDVAAKNPDQLWVGIEVYEVGVASVIRQAKEKGLENIIVLTGDVMDFLEREQAHQLFDHIRIFFPDPWPKKRHHKRRLVQGKSLDVLASIMKPSAVLHFATDHLPYAEDVELVLSNSQYFKPLAVVPFRPETKFARKAKEAGVVITDIAVERI
ncbi:tRNA (guanosine(46)-N7)-methyltransferase TrmB [Candidatus Comchoanobacter bicostacola]|uniref:tRNA (guanine-N(7)-)-methyltransferase n=1 Tax=Candidatus Comchoanobacter bicostacola TaxID=2919598 RepID=A0ABY5DKU3_9GAMM|nr:tRNA (guanosine(46)-N7)-methyltransferase TrmB [Candidatus Comchoanobacter bicostacola]UTC24770.1 tRNA (guanosine(46)-N7)-methyltransferase TrmB [Candidatus Comchoanobacter bicostacola]